MVKIKPLGVTSRNYAEGCLRAFLEGKKNLKWIVGTIIKSGVRGEERRIFSGLIGFGDRSRFEQIEKACEELGLFSSSSLI